MEKQLNMDMTYKEAVDEDEQMDEVMEDQFLKGLYLFMRKRDTPIERIPHLGFKQIDLFLMYKTVGDFGGYYKVTSQQLWKQVYNRLGGNPRSTSAATCTRRHYEKLLLPYECHLKGIAMNTVPPQQQKHFLYTDYTKDNCDDPRPAKRKLLSLQMHQSPTDPQSDHHGSVFHPSLHYPHYYPSSHEALPQYVPISSPPVLTSTQMPSSQISAPESNFSFHQPHLRPTERVKEPLEHLRNLAEQYKTSSGLMEPLNLSVKASSQETNRTPVSSFSPPSSSKTPKFLNKPSPLYTPRRPEGVRSDGCETEDAAEENAGVSPYSYPATASEAYVMDVKSTAASISPMHGSPMMLRADEGAAVTAQKPSSSPKTDFTTWSRQEREGSPEGNGLSLRHLLPGLGQVNGGKMEIQIPLSVLHNWLKVYGSSATVAKQLKTPKTEEEEQPRQGNSYGPTGQTFHTHSRHHWSPPAEDLQLRQRNPPSPQTPTATPQTSSTHHDTSPNHLNGSSKPSPSGGSLKRPFSPGAYPDDLSKSYRSYWDAYNKEPHMKTSSSPVLLQQDFTPAKSYGDDASRGGRERSEAGHTSMFMLNASGGAVLQLTTEEVMKLKKMISSSS